jgi:chromosome segregation ATPase
MSLNERLSVVLQSQLGLLRELREARQELAVVQGRVRMRLADLEQQASEAQEHYRQAVGEGDPQAEALQGWPVRIHARIEELKAAVADLEATEASVLARIEHAEHDIEDFRILQPQIIARVAAARTAGLGRDVFETLSDALSYVEIALGAAESEDSNGPLRNAGRNGRPEPTGKSEGSAAAADPLGSLTDTEF